MHTNYLQGIAWEWFVKDAYPINILPRLKEVPEIVNVYCATANPIEVIFVETGQGRGILGVVDGFKSKGIETERDVEAEKILPEEDRIQSLD